MKKVYIFGAGGFGREIAWLINSLNGEFQIEGFIDDTPDLANSTLNDIKVVGNTDYLLQITESINVVIAVGNSLSRKKIVGKLRENQNIRFPNIIADDVQMSKYNITGEGCIICHSNIITVNVELGNFVICNLDCTIGHDAILEDYVTLFPSVNVSGNTLIRECCEIGTGTNIIQGKTIGMNSIVGAGSVVIKDIADNCVAVGVPAKVIKIREK